MDACPPSQQLSASNAVQPADIKPVATSLVDMMKESPVFYLIRVNDNNEVRIMKGLLARDVANVADNFSAYQEDFTPSCVAEYICRLGGSVVLTTEDHRTKHLPILTYQDARRRDFGDLNALTDDSILLKLWKEDARNIFEMSEFHSLEP